MKQNFIFV